jgi:hypothetical protein
MKFEVLNYPKEIFEVTGQKYELDDQKIVCKNYNAKCFNQAVCVKLFYAYIKQHPLNSFEEAVSKTYEVYKDDILNEDWYEWKDELHRDVVAVGGFRYSLYDHQHVKPDSSHLTFTFVIDYQYDSDLPDSMYKYIHR